VRGRGLLAAKEDLFVVVATVVQVAFLLSRRRPGPWWRVGAAFAVLAFFLGWGFWDDALSGVPRTLLPLALAFNVLAPRTRRGLALLLAGNLTVLSAATVLDVVPCSSDNLPEGVTAEFGAGFYALERSWRRSWRWSSGPASLRLHNPNAEPRRATLEGELISETDRSVTIAAPGARQVVTLPAHRRVSLRFGPFPLPPGDTTVTFDTAEPPWPEPGPGGRALAFSLRQMRLGMTGAGTP